MSLIEKYTPNKLDELIYSKQNIHSIKNWLETFHDATNLLKRNGLLKKSTKGRKKKIIDATEQELEYVNKKANLLIIGPHGSGKSLLVKLLLEDMNYEVIHLNSIDSDHLNIEFIEKIIKPSIFDENPDIKKILLIDELESLITRNDKKNILNIIKTNNYSRNVPTIIISNEQHNSHLTEIKKITNVINFTPLTNNEIKEFMLNICKTERIKISFTVFDKFIELCNNDIRKILYLLDELNIIYKDKSISKENLLEINNIMNNSNNNINLIQITKELLTNFKNINTSYELFKIDNVTIPLMLYENYHKYIDKKNYNKIIENISFGDVINNYIHGEQNWDLMEIYGIISCSIPSYYINKYKNTNKYIPIVYTSEFNKTSVQKHNKKNFNYFDKSIEEFIYIKDISNIN